MTANQDYKTLLTLKNVETDSNIILVDTDETYNLQMFCSDSDNVCDKSKIAHLSRGVVFSGANLVLKGYPHINTLSVKDMPLYITNSDIPKFRSFISYEGTLIRVFYFKNKWFVSTHRKLDAFKSKWSSRETFGESFTKGLWNEYQSNSLFRKHVGVSGPNSIINDMTKCMDIRKQYMFLVLPNKDNRIVCQVQEKNVVYHVGTFIDHELDTECTILDITKPESVKFDSVDELANIVSKMDTQKYQGVIMFREDGEVYKLVNDNYKLFFDLRGNVESVRFRYLQVRKYKCTRNLMRELYSEKIDEFDKIEAFITNLVSNIWSKYQSICTSTEDSEKQSIYSTMSTVERSVYDSVVKKYGNNGVEDNIRKRVNGLEPVAINKMIRLEKESRKIVTE
jgi:hypothetical protein